jgi:formylmethanofuran dehydrogenase subunit E
MTETLIGINCDDCGETAYFALGCQAVSGRVICIKCSTEYHKEEE